MINISDTSFLIPLRIDSEDRLQNIYTVTQYLTKYFQCEILLTEIDSEQKIDIEKLGKNTRYTFAYDAEPRLRRAKYFNQLTLLTQTPYIALYDSDIIFPLAQIQDAVHVLREGIYSVVSPYDGNFVGVDYLLKRIFINMQNPELFEANKGKLITGTKRSYGGAVFLNRAHYIAAGMENEYLTSWGPDDVERIKRMDILGYRIKRLKGNLYHLPHKRSDNSFYQSIDNRIELMSVYLKTCSLGMEDMQDYIKTWPWTVQTY